MLGEDYNTGYSRNPINLTISDSDITHRLYSYSDVAMIVHRVVSADGATDPKTTVIINNSHIVTEASLVEAYQGHKTPDGGVDTNAASKSNMKVFLNGTTIIAKSLASGEIKEGSIIFYEDVKTNLESTDNISFVITLSKVNTDDGLAPYMYTSHDYATVTWSDGVTELWAGGSLPVHETCKFDSISFVEAGKHYDFSNTMSSAPFGFYANLTLSNSREFNLYVPETYAGAEVYIDGNLIEAGSEITYVGVAGKMCYNYTIALAPHLSAKEFHILIILPDGKQMSRVASVGAYAVSLFNRINGKTDAASLKDMALLKVVIAYIRAASAYSGFTTDMNLIEVVRSKVGTAQTTAPTGTQYDTSALTAYFTGAQINLLENCRYRFNVKSGADVSGIRFVVNGEEKEAIKAADGSYIELELSAYDMCADIEIYLADAATPIAYYNLYTYYVGLYSISTGSASGAQREATKALELIKSIYTYATVANEYLNH